MPKKADTIRRSDTRITHDESEPGTMGQEYFIKLIISYFDIHFKSIYWIIRILNIMIIIAKNCPNIIAINKPIRFQLKTPKNKTIKSI